MIGFTSLNLLAAFVWPTLFWGGAAAVSAPILIHLLARRRFKRIRWAAIQFLIDAERRNRRRIRMEDVILLLLRCLALLLIAMLIARPFFAPKGLAALLGGSERTERIIILDDSYSMAYSGGADSAFDQAKRGVRSLIEIFREQSPRDSITLLRASTVGTPSAAGVVLDTRQTEELFTSIEGMTVSQQALAPRDLFDSVRTLLDERTESIAVAVYLFSDFQRKDWVTNSTDAREGAVSPVAILSNWSDDQRSLKLILVDVGFDDACNTAVARLASKRGSFVADVPEYVEAELVHYCDQPATSLRLEVTAGASPQSLATVDRVQPNSTLSVPLSVRFARPGWQWVTAALPEDNLPLDNERNLAIETVDAMRVLIVNGEPSSDAYRDEVGLLATALRPPGEVFSGNAPDVIDETEFEEVDLSQYDVVLIANVYHVGERVADALSTYVAGGGGVAFLLGDQVDPDAYNTVLFDEGRGLLPAQLSERFVSPAGARIQIDDRLHPMVRVLAGDDNPFAANITFDQYFVVAPTSFSGIASSDAQPGAPATDESESDAIFVGAARTLAHYSGGEGHPAVVERTYGQGRVLMFTSTCDQEWNDWAKDPSYVVSMLELARYLGSGAGVSTDRLVGAPIEIEIDPEKYASDVRVRTPRYPAEQEVPLTARAEENRPGFRVRWNQTEVAGVYQFVLTRHNGEEEIRTVAVNLDPAESDLRPAVETELRQSLTEMDFAYIDNLDTLGEVGGDARREYWKTVLIAVFILLMGEQFLGWWFGRRA